MTAGNGRDRAKEIALNIGAIAGVICIVATAVALVFGIKPLVFRSGSMAPQISTGSLAFARTVPATDVAVGDVISVHNAQGTRVSHRVIDVQPAGDGAVNAILQGDANNVADREPYTITEADRVFFHVGGLGYAVAWLSSPLATFLGGGLVGAVLVLAFGQTAGRRAVQHSDDTKSTAAFAADTPTELQEAHHD